MAKDPDSDITTMSSKQVFSDWSIGDVVKAKVVNIKERLVQRYTIFDMPLV